MRNALLLLLVFPFLVKGQSMDMYKKEVFRTKNGFALPYRILYPEDYDSSKQYPLVVFLHGVLEKGNDNERQLVNGGALFIKNRKRFPAIVIFPQCAEESYWASVDIDQTRLPIKIAFRYEEPPTAAMEACIGLITFFLQRKKADPGAVYILGLSMGGMGTFEAISRYPDLFAAAVPICGAGDTSYCNRYAGKVAIWAFHGGADTGIDPDESRSIVRKLKTIGSPVRYTEYAGVGHNCWDKTLAEPELLPWMFSQKKRKEQKKYFFRKRRTFSANTRIK